MSIANINITQGGFMAVEMVELKVMVPKECEDVAKFLVELVADIKAKKTISEIAGENLANLMAAVNGFEALGAEVKTPEAYDCFALMGSGIAKALLA
jgi:hypothetical protein